MKRTVFILTCDICYYIFLHQHNPTGDRDSLFTVNRYFYLRDRSKFFAHRWLHCRSVERENRYIVEQCRQWSWQMTQTGMDTGWDEWNTRTHLNDDLSFSVCARKEKDVVWWMKEKENTLILRMWIIEEWSLHSQSSESQINRVYSDCLARGSIFLARRKLAQREK